MVINLKTCIGCGACVAACSEENSIILSMIKEGAQVKIGSRTDIEVVEEGRFPSAKRIYYHHICMQCEDPPCVKVCPTGASYITKDGVVLINYEHCIGCRYCVVACPYGARYVNEELRAPDKCTFCYHRIKEGLLPACVEACPTHSRIFGDLDNPNSEVFRLSLRAVRPNSPKGTNPKVYIIPP